MSNTGRLERRTDVDDPLKQFRLDGQVAVVTGASAGLGQRFARVLHAAGASVVIAARRAERLEALAETLGDRVLVAPCDIAEDADCVRLIEDACSLTGRIDVLVNNAGIGTPIAAEDESMDDFRRVIDVNLTAVFQLCQLAGRRMLEHGSGSIVNIASILGLVAAAPLKHASYAASKGAVVNMTRELGAQWARRGVRVNAIAPGWFDTEMTEGMGEDEASMRYVRNGCPMGRMGEADELDGVMLFLASGASSYVTGVTIPVDGGWTAR